MDAALNPTPPTPAVASPKINNSHQSPKNKSKESRHTLYFHNTNREHNSSGRSTIQEINNRPVLTAKRRHPTNLPPASTTETQSSSSTVKAQSSAHKESQPRPPNHVYESKVAQTFKAFQVEQGHQTSSMRNGHNMQNSNLGSRQGRREKLKDFEETPDPDANRKVLVSGFPSYTQSQELARVLSELGPSQILRCRNRLAVVMFETEQLAQNAINSSDELYIYGEFIQIYRYTNARHVEEMFRSYKKVITKKKGIDIIEPTKIDLSGEFSQQFENVQRAVRLTREEVVDITQLYVDLEAALHTVWPGCRAIPFGSIPTGLGIKSSDADCFVEGVSGSRGGGGSATFVNRTRRVLAQRPDLFAQLVAIPRANTPIVKFLHRPTNRHCDVSAKTPLGSQNSRLIKSMMDGDPRLGPLAVFIKYWAKVHELTGTGRLTNYALVMMFIFYLQQPHVGLAPPVELLQRERSATLVVDHWDAGFQPRTDLVKPNSGSLADLLGEFFRFYSGFDFDELAVCPLLGTAVKKATFEDLNSLPPQFERYVTNVGLNLVGPLRHGTAFCVQDPFELSHNVASSVSEKLGRDIRAYFKFAAEAYERDRDGGSPQFLRTILLSKPKLERRERPAASSRIFLIPRVRGDFLEPDWRSVVRGILLDKIFATMLRMRLEREEAGGSADKERYAGRADKPVWRRKLDPRPPGSADAIVRRHEQITARILATGTEATPLRFRLELGFRDAPSRSCYALVKLVEGEFDAFRGFVRFFHSAMFEWFHALLKPFLKVDGDRGESAEEAAEREAAPVTFERSEGDVTRLFDAVSLDDDT